MILFAEEQQIIDKQTSNLHFRLMSLGYRFRDSFMSPADVLEEAGIKPGFHVLDYGCGPGSYSIAAATIVTDSGKVYALDIHPLAIQRVQDIALKKQLANVETIVSDCQTGLPDNSLDAVLLYDAFHHLSDPDVVLKELHRVLKPDGILSFGDHHLKEKEIVAEAINDRLFKLLRKGERTYTFLKEE